MGKLGVQWTPSFLSGVVVHGRVGGRCGCFIVGLYRFEGADDSGKTRYNLGFPDEGNNRCLYSCKSLQHEKKNRIDRYRRINHLVIFLVYLM